jgi:diaminopimelate decarboxylase
MSLHESYRVTRTDTMRAPLIEAVCKSARSVGTPFWLYETEPMRQRVRQLRAFDCIRFAQKANKHFIFDPYAYQNPPQS